MILVKIKNIGLQKKKSLMIYIINMSTSYWYKHQSGQVFSLNELVLRYTFVPAVLVLIKF